MKAVILAMQDFTPLSQFFGQDFSKRVWGDMAKNPQIDPIVYHGKNGAGVLLLHGFTGTPDSMRPVARTLAEEGFGVLAPLLAGHGTTPEQCAKTNWHDWHKSAEEGLAILKKEYKKVFVVGLSLGSLLTLKLAIDHTKELNGIALLATPLSLFTFPKIGIPTVRYSPLRFFWKFQKKMGVDIKDKSAAKNFWNYDRMPLACVSSLMNLQTVVKKDLNKVTAPTLLIHSPDDATAPYTCMQEVARNISSTITETVTLKNSAHIVTLDFEKELVATKVTNFFKRFL